MIYTHENEGKKEKEKDFPEKQKPDEMLEAPTRILIMEEIFKKWKIL